MASYKEIVGQEQIISHFKNAIKMDKVSHAYIISGEEGCGKRLLAEAFATALQCEAGQEEACMECHSCKQAQSYNQPDIIYISGENQTTIKVDEIRQKVNNDIVIKPYSSRYKIYIVDQAHKMNEQAQNALLKTIEEPPAYGIIILLTNNADAFLPTILSRCILLNVKPVQSEAIRSFLMREYQIPDYQADVAVAFAQGNVGKAISLARSDDFNGMKQSVIQLMKRIDTIELYELSQSVVQIHEYKMQITDYIDLMIVWFRDVLYMKATGDANGIVFTEEIYDIKKQATTHSYPGIENIINGLNKAKTRIKANVNFELVMELLLLTIKEN